MIVNCTVPSNTHVSRMHQQCLARRERVVDELAGQLDPGPALPLQLLSAKPSPPHIPPRNVCCRPMLGVMPGVPHSQPYPGAQVPAPKALGGACPISASNASREVALWRA